MIMQQPDPQKLTPIEFVKERLGMNPEASFDEIKAQAKVQALALRVVAERLEHGEAGPELIDISFQAA